MEGLRSFKTSVNFYQTAAVMSSHREKHNLTKMTEGRKVNGDEDKVLL
jgi:hypothetical protein